MASSAAFEEPLFKCQIALRYGHKKPVIQFEKIRHDFSEGEIFVDALDGGFLIGDAIAATGMQQAMVATSGAESDFPAFDDGDA